MLITCHHCHRSLDSPANAVLTLTAESVTIEPIGRSVTTYPLRETRLVCGECLEGHEVRVELVRRQPIADETQNKDVAS